jgi:hypothetical protein
MADRGVALVGEDSLDPSSLPLQARVGQCRDERRPIIRGLEHLLLPLVKGYCSDRGYDLLGNALQVFGGSGYCQDYPMEQYIRDQKIDTLYEGTTHIQALDLFFRKIARDMGETLRGLLAEVQQSAQGDDGGDALEAERQALSRALNDVQGMFGAIMGKLSESGFTSSGSFGQQSRGSVMSSRFISMMAV